MIKVTLLGDSIRQIGYGPKIPELLGDGYQVWQPNDNCRFAQYTLRGMYDWRGDMEGTQIVHWNNGLWDICDILGDGGGLFTSLDFYCETMVRIGKILKSRYGNVIFATTTPVTDENLSNNNEYIEQYNKAIVPQLESIGIVINDLYGTISQDIDKYIRHDDNIHLSDEGIAVAAAQVADSIKKVAEGIR